MLVESDVLPTTSQANPAAFEEAFAQAVEADCQVVCITCSAGLSGTYQSALIAAEEFPGNGLLRNFLADGAKLWQDKLETPPAGCIGSVVGTHTGPGVVAVAFFSAEE